MTEKPAIALSPEELLDKACRYVTLQVPFAEAADYLAELKQYHMTLSAMRHSLAERLNAQEETDPGHVVAQSHADICKGLFLGRNLFLMDICLRDLAHRHYNSTEHTLLTADHEQELLRNITTDTGIARDFLHRVSTDFIHGYMRDDLVKIFPRTACPDQMHNSCLKAIGLEKVDTISEFINHNHILNVVYMAELGELIEHARHENFETIAPIALQDYYANQNNRLIESGEETAVRQKDKMQEFLQTLMLHKKQPPSHPFNLN